MAKKAVRDYKIEFRPPGPDDSVLIIDEGFMFMLISLSESENPDESLDNLADEAMGVLDFLIVFSNDGNTRYEMNGFLRRLEPLLGAYEV